MIRLFQILIFGFSNVLLNFFQLRLRIPTNITKTELHTITFARRAISSLTRLELDEISSIE